jgi:hypothetical protein
MMKELREVPDSKRPVRAGNELAGGGEAPYDESMIERIEKLEEFAKDVQVRLVRIETRLDTFATKEDLHKELHAMTWRLIGAAALLLTVTYWIARTIH